MPRVRRGATGPNVVHVLNRGNNRATLFFGPEDYRHFVSLLEKTRKQFDLTLYAFAVMPNHFHLIAHPASVPQLSEFMRSWQGAYAQRVHKRNGSSGHVWQGRFKSFPIQDGEHLLTALRYVLRNPVSAGLGQTPFAWPWTSLHHRRLVARWPVVPPRDLQSWLSEPESETAVARIRESVAKRIPFGDAAWQQEMAEQAGLETTLRRPGRPSRGDTEHPLLQSCG